MFELTADGPEIRQRWRSTLDAGAAYVLGRGGEADLPVPWDAHISRRHARLSSSNGTLLVEKLPEAGNPVFYEGRSVDSCRVSPGEIFVIGSTVFRVNSLRVEALSPELPPVEEVAFNRQQLQKVRYRDADKRIEVLTHLPEVILDSRSDAELYHQLANLLLAGVPGADAVAIVQLADRDDVRMLHWERRRETAGEFRASRRLIADAIGKRKSSVLHVWESAGEAKAAYTIMAGFDWAFCTPVPNGRTGGWGLYLAGRLDRSLVRTPVQTERGIELQADIKFTELVAEIISSVRRVNQLERQQAGLRQFFSPRLLDMFGDDFDIDQLEPRECDVTVMFCDLRGFSLQAEESSDNLAGLLDRVSLALGVMNRCIFEFGGVTGDFQGDAALGFWGWPFGSSEAPLDACRAALKIRLAFAEHFGDEGHPLANFQMGIGIAHGRAVAGKIGTAEQVKITVFGPVVNLASRLEGMTKLLRVPVLLDEATANIVRRKLDPKEGRLRRLARVLPYGMETPVMVSELLPAETDWPELTDTHLARYEEGVDHLIAGKWEQAYRCLHEMPASDRAQDFPLMLIAQHNRVAPVNWDGIIRLPSK